MTGPLRNPRWERFAREYASGETLESAYRRAYEKSGKYAKFNASRLRHKKPVADRIDELQEQFAERSAIKLEYLQHQLLPALRANPQDLFDEQGHLKAIHELPREVASIVKSVKFDRKTGAIAEVVLVDKIAAASTLLRSLGVTDINVNATAQAASGQLTADISDAETAKAFAAFIARQKAKQPQLSARDHDEMEQRLFGDARR